ncbi:MAG: hypothetical protein ACKVP0_02775 [Pirellulaceae bacterium]
MYDGYYGKITPEVYTAAVRLRGDDDSCWEERIPLAEPPLVSGPQFPEDWFADEVIEIWEAALAQAQQKFGKGRFTLDSVSLYLVDNQNSSPDGEMIWEPNVKTTQSDMT